MSRVSDGLRLSELSLPGTHDTMAYTTPIPWARNQDLDLQEQMEAGVRFLDVRVKYENNDLVCYHGIVNLNMKLGNVMDTIKRFLDLNPSETIIFRYSDENYSSDAEYKSKFCEKFNEIVENYNLWHKESSTTDMGSQYPRLGEMRGKIVIFNWDRITEGCFGFTFQWKDLDNYDGQGADPLTGKPYANILEWGLFPILPYNADKTKETYNITKTNDKTKYFKHTTENSITADSNQTRIFPITIFAYLPSSDYKKELRDFISSADDSNDLFITWTSAFDWKCYPAKFAKLVNQDIYDFLRQSPNRATGIIVFDFITNWNSDIPELIYQRNFKGKRYNRGTSARGGQLIFCFLFLLHGCFFSRVHLRPVSEGRRKHGEHSQ